ncbi:MAG TPA: DNA recombination protein RmuC [Clostridiaceae bacterium]|nr:DNA recombination protein RmuC [Clostridiaceae bacterium]
MNTYVFLLCLLGVLVLYLVFSKGTPPETEELKEGLALLTEEISKQGEIISKQDEYFQKAIGVIERTNDKLDGMFDVLATPGGKGKMGEWALESLLKSIRINGGTKYLVQPALKGGRPDFAIPVGKKYLYIDSKFPHDSYKAFKENRNKQTFKNFISAIKRNIEPVEKYVFAEDSVGIAVLYLPTEGMMRDILEFYPKLLVDAQNKGIMVLSSFYLPYFLHMFVDCYSQLDWENNFVNKRREISSLAEETVNKFSAFRKDLEKVNASARECEKIVFRLHDALQFNVQKNNETSLKK